MKIKNYIILFILFYGNMVFSQVLCSGSFGSPIVNITFGSGNNPGGQLPSIVTGASTSYRYSPVTGSPPASVFDGEYSIINQGPANNGAWIAGYDHTGNTKGYMAFFNAADSIGEFYKQVITGINPNTVYEFAAWVTNVLKPSVVSNPSYPNITFEIRNNTNNALLATYNTGNVPMSNTGSLVWKQYGFLFSTPQNISSIKLLLINNNAGGLALPGNDLAIDDITFR
jgi:hypothetical protein